MKTPYWIALHYFLIQEFFRFVSSTLWFFFPETIAHQSPISWDIGMLVIFTTMAFSAYLSPYRWFWLLWVGGGITLPALIGFFSYIIPFGHLSFWLAAKLANLGIPAHILELVFKTVSLHVYVVYVTAFILPTLLLSIKVKQIYNIDQKNVDIENKTKDKYAGRYTNIGVLFLSFFVLLHFATLIWATFSQQGAMLGNSTQIDPSAIFRVPTHSLTEWYLLAPHSILRSIPDETLGIISLLAICALPLALPWIDKGNLKPFWQRPFCGTAYVLLIISFIAITLLGTLPPEGATIWWTRIFTVYCLLYFSLLIPLLSRLERSNRSCHYA